MAKIINGTNAADKLMVLESGVTVNAGTGNDVINVRKGTGGTVNGDKVYIHAGSHTVYGVAVNK